VDRAVDESTAGAGMTAEAPVVGGLLIDGGAVAEVAGVVGVDDFTSPRWREVYAAMLALHARGVAVDYVTVACELEARGTLTRVGEANLTDVINRCPSSLYLLHYARTVARAAAERRDRPGPARGVAP
jgi:replicative DNA helicase